MKAILNTSSVVLCIYLLFAFYAWDFNPGNWHEAVRLSAALAVAVFCSVVFLESK